MQIPPFNPYYVTLGLLVACTLVGILVAARFRREVDEDLAPPTARELLDPLENAYYSGLMRPEEIERVRDSVKRSSVATASKPVSGTPSRSSGTRITKATEENLTNDAADSGLNEGGGSESG